MSLVCYMQSVHVKNRCAFLNHSSNAQEFMQLVEQHPNIALWFSVSPKLPDVISGVKYHYEWMGHKSEPSKLPPMAASFYI